MDTLVTAQGTSWIGFLLFMAIVVAFFIVAWRKAKKEVPPEAAAKMQAIEDKVEDKIDAVADRIEDRIKALKDR